MGNETVRRPKCKLIGKDSNVFSVIGEVSRALKKDGQLERASEFQKKAFSAESYDHVLRLATEYTEVY